MVLLKAAFQMEKFLSHKLIRWLCGLKHNLASCLQTGFLSLAVTWRIVADKHNMPSLWLQGDSRQLSCFGANSVLDEFVLSQPRHVLWAMRPRDLVGHQSLILRNFVSSSIIRWFERSWKTPKSLLDLCSFLSKEVVTHGISGVIGIGPEFWKLIRYWIRSNVFKYCGFFFNDMNMSALSFRFAGKTFSA